MISVDPTLVLLGFAAVLIQLLTTVLGLIVAIISLWMTFGHGKDISEIKSQTNHMNEALRVAGREDRANLQNLTQQVIDHQSAADAP
jgi:biopolymer transport protein ExbB/TolQ